MTLSIGLIGAGGIASVHLDTLDGLNHSSPGCESWFEDIDLVAVADVNEDRARDAAKPHEATIYADGRELIKCESLDALVVAVPPYAHGDYERLAADRGIDLFIEKPIGLSMKDVMKTRTRLERAGVTTQTGYVCRYGQITERALDLLSDRSIGHITSVYWSSVPDTLWWTKRARSGGQLVEQSTHVFDLHRYFAGEVSTVVGAGNGGLLVDDIDFQESTSVTLVHESGAISHVSSTCACPTSRFEVRIVAENAFLELDFLDHSITGVVDGEPVEFDGDGRWYAREFKAFLDAVGEGSKDVRSDYTNAVRTLELTLAARESAEMDTRVRL